jgi:16S rRNA G966 N2-methylase RsmD
MLLEQYEVVVEGTNGPEIKIDEDLWMLLNERHSKEEIKELISDAIETHEVPLPYKHITSDEMRADFDRLKNLDSQALIKEGEFFTRYPFSTPCSTTYIEMSAVGGKASNYFHQESRFLCDSINAPSPFRSWTIKKFRMTLLNALWTLKFKRVDMAVLRTCIQLRKYISAQFRPSAAKVIYDYFQPADVLDFSAGWGDRLAAFCASDSTRTYVGIDPNERLFPAYKEQIEAYGENKSITMIAECAEDVVAEPDSYDLIFTSPPYFNIERYTQESNQSWKRHKKLDAWLSDFLFVAVANAWRGLRKGGHMVINLADVYSGHRINQLCDPLCDFMESLSDAEFVECWGFRMAKRPQSNAVKDGVFAEPLFIWRKI